MNKKIFFLLTITLRLSASLTPFMHDWYDARQTQMKFDFDYNQYDPQLTYSTVQATSSGTTQVISTDMNGLVDLNVELNEVVPLGTGATSYAQISTAQGIDWASGHETHFMFTFVIPNSNLSTTMEYTGSLTAETQIGIFDAFDGVGFKVINTTSTLGGSGTSVFGVFTRNDGIDTTITGTGISLPAGFSFDDLNMYRIVVTDKSTGPITFDVYDGVNNTWYVIYQLTNLQSTLTVPQLRTLKLPLSALAEINFNVVTAGGSASSAAAELKTTGWHVMTVGDAYTGAIRRFSTSASASVPAAETQIFTLKNNGISGAKTNHVAVKLKGFGASGQHHAIFNMYRNATVTGTSFSNIDIDNSVMQKSTAGTFVSGTGTPVFSTGYNAAIGNVPLFDSDIVTVMMYPGDTLTITSQLPFDVSDQIFASIIWEELF
jgi:hypothetical protein